MAPQIYRERRENGKLLTEYRSNRRTLGNLCSTTIRSHYVLRLLTDWLAVVFPCPRPKQCWVAPDRKLCLLLLKKEEEMIDNQRPTRPCHHWLLLLPLHCRWIPATTKYESDLPAMGREGKRARDTMDCRSTRVHYRAPIELGSMPFYIQPYPARSAVPRTGAQQGGCPSYCKITTRTVPGCAFGPRASGAGFMLHHNGQVTATHGLVTVCLLAWFGLCR